MFIIIAKEPCQYVLCCCMTYCCSHFLNTSASTFHVLDQLAYSPDRVLRAVFNTRMWLSAKVKTFCSAAIISLSNTGHWFKNGQTLLRNDVCLSSASLCMAFYNFCHSHGHWFYTCNLHILLLMLCLQHTHPHVHPPMLVHCVVCFLLSFLTRLCWLFLHPFLLPHVLPFLLTPIHLLARSLTHTDSLTRTDSLTLTHSHWLSLTHADSHSQTHSHTHLLTHSYSLTHLFTHPLNHMLTLLHSLSHLFALFLHTCNSLKHCFDVSTVHRGWV